MAPAVTVPSAPRVEIELEETGSTHDDSAPKLLPKNKAESESRFQQQGYDIDTDVRNMWYPIAVAAEVNNKRPEGLHIVGDPIVIFRDKDGHPVCLADKCAHRSAPLSTGQIVDGILECKYHGWQYDTDGLVTRIPSLLSDRKIPSNAKTYSYPVHEQDDLLWVWPGDKDKADIALVPHMKPGNYLEQGAHYNEHKWGNGTLYVQDLDIDHSLMVENLLDPAHIHFTHNGTIGNRDKAGSLNMHLVPMHNGIAGLNTDGTEEGEKRGGMNAGEPEFIFRAPCHIQLQFKFKDDWLFHQTIHCVPTRRGHMRIIYRESRTFFTISYKLRFLSRYTENFSKKVIFQDYELLRGQQNRLRQGAKEWNSPIQVDLLPRLYRQWWKVSFGRRGAGDPWFKGYSGDIEDLMAPDAPYCAGCTDVSDDPEPMFKKNPYIDYNENHPERLRARKQRSEMIKNGAVVVAGAVVVGAILARTSW